MNHANEEPAAPGTAQEGEGRRARLLGSRRLKVRIALGCALVLGLGALSAPPVSPTTIAPSTERAAPLLTEQVQQRTVVESFRGLQSVASRVRGQSLTVPAQVPGEGRTRWDFERSPDPDARPGGFAVRVDEAGHVLTHGAALRGRASLSLQSADGRAVGAELVAFEPTTGLALLRTTNPGSVPVVSFAGLALEPGSLVLASAEANGTSIAVPAYVTRVREQRLRVSGTSNDVAPGMPLYDADGGLVGVMGEDPQVAFDARTAVTRLIGAAAAGTGLTSAIGVSVQPLTPALAAAFGADGVLVSDLLTGGPADAAGLRAGDVVVRVGTAPVRTSDEFYAALRALPVGGAIDVGVRRNGGDTTLPVTTASTFTVEAAARSAAPADPGGVVARDLAPLLATGRTDVPADARVLTVNGRAVSSLAEARQALRRRGPVVLHLVQDGRRFFHVVEPQP